ncbi:hypothetical protein GE09DRAFT_1141424 [Coniochaeta sp. 2T2.1]|nr:hypothetical protein GE09DRAFT_1141424 [Coniochaeta sp. 2T2.1]
MCDPMAIDVSLPTGAVTLPFPTEGDCKQRTVPARKSRSVRSTNAEKRLRTKRAKRKLGRLTNNIPKLVRPNPIAFFVAHLENVLEDWLTILVRTRSPSSITSSDPFVATAFQLLDNTINESGTMRSRFAHIQLLCIFKSLEDMIASERRAGQIQRQRGRRNASVAITIYKNAQQRPVSGRDLIERKRTARRWQTLAGPSPFFLVIYSEVAETLVKRSSKIDKRTLESLAASILQKAPPKLINACQRLAETAELATTQDQSFDKQRAIEEIRHDLLDLSSDSS